MKNISQILTNVPLNFPGLSYQLGERRLCGFGGADVPVSEKHGQRWSMSPLQYKKHLFVNVFCCACNRILTTSKGVTEREIKGE